MFKTKHLDLEAEEEEKAVMFLEVVMNIDLNWWKHIQEIAVNFLPCKEEGSIGLLKTEY